MRISYAQNAEDIVLERLFAEQATGFYVDVGAGDPVTDSVTKRFYDRGWWGVNIEPEKIPYLCLARDRPRDRNERIAVGVFEGWTDLQTYENKPGWSTTSQEIQALHYSAGLRGERQRVWTARLDSVLDGIDAVRIDILKIDVEGSEYDVLHSIDLAKFLPRVVVVEATFPGATVERYELWEPALVEAGYCAVLFDGVNRFYVLANDSRARTQLAVPANSNDQFIPYKWWRLLDDERKLQVKQE